MTIIRAYIKSIVPHVEGSELDPVTGMGVVGFVEVFPTAGGDTKMGLNLRHSSIESVEILVHML